MTGYDRLILAAWLGYGSWRETWAAVRILLSKRL